MGKPDSPTDARARLARKGRGAASRNDGRFEPYRHEAADDGWGALDEPLPPLRTTVATDTARSVITHNDSPDIPFDQSLNPYRGCEHGCVYCLSGDTPILMRDGSLRSLAEVRVGDLVYGTVRRGWYRRYVTARVLNHWSVIKPAYRVTLEDGTTLIAGADHRFLTERGWKFVAGAGNGGTRRPHLTTNNKLMGTGAFARAPLKGHDYRCGYLCGLIRDDALLASYRYARAGRTHGDQHQFRLVLCDAEALRRAEEFLSGHGIAVHGFLFQAAGAARQALHAIRTHARLDVERIRALIAWRDSPSVEWSAGFLAGIFDAEGSYSQGVLRIINTDGDIVARIGSCLRVFGFPFVVERVSRERTKPVLVVRLNGGLREHLRFFHTTDPAIRRKCDIAGQAVKCDARLGVVNIEPLGAAMRLYDITTETGDFIADGVVSHNCYARPSHAYLGLSPGLDFETRLYAKHDAPELLRTELRRPGYRPRTLALGVNTDAYQPIERRLQLTRRVLEVLAACDHPVSLITKSSLIERDIDLLAPMAQKGLVQAFVTVTTLKHELARKLEPRATAPTRRVETLRRLADAGIPVGVMVAPVIPVLTDGEIESILGAAHEAGARHAGYVLLRLPHEIKDLFKEWLELHAPLAKEHVLARLREARGGRDNDPRFGSRMVGEGEYARLIGQRFALAYKRLGFNRVPTVLATDRFRPPPAAGDQLDLFR